MIVLTVLSTALAAFLSGFLLGSFKKPAKMTKKVPGKAAYEAEIERLQKEYSNFLNYDGSEQS